MRRCEYIERKTTLKNILEFLKHFSSRSHHKLFFETPCIILGNPRKYTEIINKCHPKCVMFPNRIPKFPKKNILSFSLQKSKSRDVLSMWQIQKRFKYKFALSNLIKFVIFDEICIYSIKNMFSLYLTSGFILDIN